MPWGGRPGGWVQVIKAGESDATRKQDLSCSAESEKSRVQRRKQVATTTPNLDLVLVLCVLSCLNHLSGLNLDLVVGRGHLPGGGGALNFLVRAVRAVGRCPGKVDFQHISEAAP